MDALNHENKNNFFYCDDIARIESEICGIWRKKIFNMKRVCSSFKFKKRVA